MHRFDDVNVIGGGSNWPYPNIIHLGYHYVRDGKAPGPCCSPNRLRLQIETMKDIGYEILTCREVVWRLLKNKPLPVKHATISFDDGLRDHCTTVIPILREYGVPATFFYIACALDEKLPPVIGFQILIGQLGAERIEQEVLPDVLKGTPYADLLDSKRFDVSGRKMGEVPEMRRIKWVFNHFLPQAFKQDCISEMFSKYLGADAEKSYVFQWFMHEKDLIDMRLTDGMEIASHSYSHPSFDVSGIADIFSEVVASKKRLENLSSQNFSYNIATQTFGWPFGGEFRGAVKEVVACEYFSAWNFHSALKEMPANPYKDLMDIPRLHEQVFLPEVK